MFSARARTEETSVAKREARSVVRGRRRDDEPVAAEADPISVPTLASPLSRRLGFALWIAALLALYGFLPRSLIAPGHEEVFFTLGVIGTWRYAWALVHFTRYLAYRFVSFPRHRHAADAAVEEALATRTLPRVFALVTSYRMEAQVTHKVYEALFREASAYGAPVTIVAAVTDTAEMRYITSLHARLADRSRVSLVLMRQAGTGKRDAMAEALRAIVRRRPRPDDVVLLMDGDTYVKRGTFHKAVGFFRTMPDLGALTTDNYAIVEGNDWVKEWYDLRLAHRHMTMSSLSLSRRLLVLTGRFSMFRASVATDPSFIDRLQNDAVDHWRHGNFRFLTGDDKSTWYWTLSHGYRMLYLPDLATGCFEKLPTPRFVEGTTRLMVRWFGNMLRSNGRAVALGPRRAGLFTWFCLLDQRISMWTALCGPSFALLSAVTRNPAYLVAYAVWVLCSRFFQGVALGALRGRVSPHFPFLLYYTQLYGALLKIHMSFRIDQQSWTRQGLSSARASLKQLFWTRYFTALAGATFLTLMAIASKALPSPTASAFRPIVGSIGGDGAP